MPRSRQAPPRNGRAPRYVLHLSGSPAVPNGSRPLYHTQNQNQNENLRVKPSRTDFGQGRTKGPVLGVVRPALPPPLASSNFDPFAEEAGLDPLAFVVRAPSPAPIMAPPPVTSHSRHMGVAPGSRRPTTPPSSLAHVPVDGVLNSPKLTAPAPAVAPKRSRSPTITSLWAIQLHVHNQHTRTTPTVFVPKKSCLSKTFVSADYA
ncbi:hypothetical protein CYLTODRAFT_418755 [Cylindrobasidium torrendii FP15055 ss-10]|uniref:Uncharacterized protein n=1 Tax=Cylindrobasidium torrendii FP15055 ss-10 TaxID=1314674 RepID=A0A0D7BLT5_9AGAR|nr:hypothetical protein CYLTODRAFT_418755 [Cylindrobasidium torrendii FP15055 ss-10]